MRDVWKFSGQPCKGRIGLADGPYSLPYSTNHRSLLTAHQGVSKSSLPTSCRELPLSEAEIFREHHRTTIMSTNSLGLNTATLRSTLPFLTGGLHTLGAFSGLYFLLAPAEGAKLFGIPFQNPSSPSPTEAAFTKLHGIRDLATALVGLRLINYAYTLEVQGNAVAAKAVGHAVGALLFVGTAFALGDGWICSEYVKQPNVKGEDEELAQNISTSHIAMSVPIALLGLAWLYV